MRKFLEFTVNIKPIQASLLILEDEDIKSDLVFQDFKATEDKEIAILVFEKYFLRNNSTATLTVILDNYDGKTTVKCISTGNGSGVFDFGLGAGDSFIKPVKKQLKNYIIEIANES